MEHKTCRLLDRMVALKVLKWVEWEGPQGFKCIGDRACGGHRSVPYFSSSIEDAWQIVSLLNEEKRNITIAHSPVTDRWLVQFLSKRKPDGGFESGETGSAEHPDVCVAICLAALQVAGVPKSDMSEFL